MPCIMPCASVWVSSRLLAGRTRCGCVRHGTGSSTFVRRNPYIRSLELMNDSNDYSNKVSVKMCSAADLASV